MQIETLAHDQVRFDHKIQPRVPRDNAKHIQKLAKLYQDGIDIEPIVVFLDDEGVYWCADGFNRGEALAIAEIDTVQCDVRDGSWQDAFAYAPIENVTPPAMNTKHSGPALPQRRKVPRQWAYINTHPHDDMAAKGKELAALMTKRLGVKVSRPDALARGVELAIAFEHGQAAAALSRESHNGEA